MASRSIRTCTRPWQPALTAAAFERKGTVRCSECGTFHSGIHMEERNAPANPEPVQREPIDPTAYSLSAEQALPDEIFEETEDLSELGWWFI